MPRSRLRSILAAAILLSWPLVAAAASAAAANAPADTSRADADSTRTAAVASWLRLGPEAAPLPAFHDAADKGFAVKDFLDQGALRPVELAPRDGDRVPWPGGDGQAWTVVAGDPLELTGGGEGPAQAYLAFYVGVDRWLKAKLTLRSRHPLRAYLDGAKIDLSSGGGDDGGDVPASQGDLSLPIGKHLVIVHAVRDPGVEEPWTVAGSLAVAADLPPEALAVGTDPTRAVDIHDVLDAPRIAGAQISPDGELVAVRLRRRDRDGRSESWVELLRVRDGKPVRTWRGDLEMSSLAWAPDGKALSYTTTDEKTSAIWLYDLESGRTTELAAGIEDLESYRWLPDASGLIYAFGVEAKPDERKIKRVLNPADRQPWWRNRSYLVEVAVPDGASRRLTAGPLSADGWRIAPDGSRILFFQSDQDLSARPYFTSELWELDLGTLAASQVLADPWIGGAEFSPDGKTLALQGSPSAFDGLGRNLPEGVQANDYGGQLYLYDPAAGTPTAVSRDLRPDIGWLDWSRADGNIYALCTDTQYRHCYRYEPGKGRWTRIETGLEFADGMDLARDARTAVAWGTDVSTPDRLYAVDLKRNEARLLLDPGADWYRDVAFGEVRDWSFTMPDGDVIDGFFYLPPGFDASRTYPLIVYYYGGTSPVTRDYGGRYPKNVWTGEGYVVYVPEPSGATGYGQEFAARHVNDWGKRTVAEVIEGTEQFLAAHDFCDPAHVGCIGASYGGFMTMSLVAHTDIYAAAVSHAGISDITSYWGEGYWGYDYGARALANSFPWQNPEIFIDRSPLFRADKITTPLLLVHGSADTNVPVGESIQLFTALKLLGRDVELVEIEGQNHWILDHDQRIVWNDTILAWFARRLKGRPEWWNALYPPAPGEGGE